MIDGEIQFPKVRPPEDVGDRLAPHPPANHLVVALRGGGFEHLLRVRMKRSPVGADDRREHHLGVEARRIHPRSLQLLDRERERFADR